jgi:hypothetical protein
LINGGIHAWLGAGLPTTEIEELPRVISLFSSIYHMLLSIELNMKNYAASSARKFSSGIVAPVKNILDYV